MGNKVSVRLNGAEGLRRKLLALVPKVRRQTADAVSTWLLLVETDAKLLCPVDTGRLRASIHAERAGNGLSGTVSTNVAYAPHIEFGRQGQAAQPFLFPAFEKNRPAFMAVLKNVVKLP